MNWMHRVDREWLEARKNYLSASDVKKLIPVTATGKPRANIEEAYLKAWADKQCSVTEDDIVSTGAMARGHLLEPYALAEFNKISGMPTLYHWDDALIYSMEGLSCSPDSLDIEQLSADVEVFGEEIKPKYLGEVKSYNGAAHYQAGLADPLTLEDRWQIAAAFYTMPTLISAVLIMFNPTAKHPLFYHTYSRHTLSDELDMIDRVTMEYRRVTARFDSSADVSCPVKQGCISEEDIIAELIEKQDIEAGLNP